jgi:Protein of unknown function (DUF4233)
VETVNDRAAKEWAARQRGARESLLSIVLGLEAAVIFFAALAVFGLHLVQPVVILSVGLGLIVVFALVSRVQRYRWGVGLGWLAQAVLLATGIVVPLMYLVAAGFIALWVFCFIRGGTLDRAKAAMMAEMPDPQQSAPSPKE